MSLIKKYIIKLDTIITHISTGRLMVLILDRISMFNNIRALGTSFIRIRSFPKSTNQVDISSIKPQKTHEDIGIIIQGPIVNQNKFTIETVKWYSNIFPNVTILISTWNNQRTDDIESLCSERIILLKSDLPEKAGTLNFNYQQKSTLTALKFAHEIGLKYILKSRSDQRIYNKDLLVSLLDRIQSKNITHDYRLVCCDTFSYLNFPFHYSDMLMFGTVIKMLSYWNIAPMISEMNKKEYSAKVEDKYTIEEMIASNIMPPEVYLGMNFAKTHYGVAATVSPKYYHEKLLKEHLTFVDFKDCDLYWHKYTSRLPLGWFELDQIKEPLTYSRWLRFIVESNHR